MEVVSNISMSAKPNPDKPIKFFHYWKLTNESILNGGIMIEMGKTSVAVFMKARKSSFVWWWVKTFI